MNKPTITVSSSIPSEELEQLQRIFPEYSITYILDLFSELEGGK